MCMITRVWLQLLRECGLKCTSGRFVVVTALITLVVISRCRIRGPSWVFDGMGFKECQKFRPCVRRPCSLRTELPLCMIDQTTGVSLYDSMQD